VIVALSDGQFTSFAYPDPTKALAAIQSHPHMNDPHMATFVIAHELGHVIGLHHNAEPGTLMCGAPAACEGETSWRLTEPDTAALRELYGTFKRRVAVEVRG
jgi:hypothetical protein